MGIDAGVAEIGEWVSLLQSDEVVKPGAFQIQAVSKASAFIEEHQTEATKLIEQFSLLSERKNAVMEGSLSWDDQFEKLELLRGDLAAFEDKCSTFISRIKATPCPAPDASLEDDLTCTEKTSEQVTAEEKERLEEENRALRSDIDKLNLDLEARQQKLKEVRQENGDLKLRVQTFEHAFNDINEPRNSAPEFSADELALAIESMVEEVTPASVLKVLDTLYGDSLRVLDGAYESAIEHANNLPVSSVFHKVKSLATDGIRAVRETGRLIDMQDVVPGHLSVQESATVRKSTKLRGCREFKDGKNSRLMYPHVTVDYHNRLYFDYSPEENRILIGYVGKHLPSARHATT
jgi:hypothetical protein